MYGGKCRHCGVTEGVGERTKSDHAEDFNAIVFECESEGFESFILSDQTLDVGGEDGSRGDEGGEGTGYGGGCYYEPTSWEAVDEAGDCYGGAVAYYGGEGAEEGYDPEDYPAAREIFPFLCVGCEGVEDGFVVDQE